MPPRKPSPDPGPLTCAVGIDLGISNSQIAISSGGTASLVRDHSGHSSLPMVVALSEGRVLCGQLARRQQLINPACVSGISRLLGRRLQTAATTAIQRRVGYRLCSDPQGRLAVELGDRVRPVEELCGVLLAQLRGMAEAYLGDPVGEALIAVPAYFDEAQHQAVKQAAALAGLGAELIEAPVAAIRALFPEQLPAGTRQAVLHLGGGSCELTLLEVGNLGTEKLAEGGDAFLGGDLLDGTIMELLFSESAASAYPELRDDPICRQRLWEAAELAKWEVGEEGEARIELPHLHLAGDQELDIEYLLTGGRLEHLARPLLDRMREMFRETLERARLQVQQIDGVILVGGQTRLPLIREAVSAFFGQKPYSDADPEGTVARGAALEALRRLEPAELELELDL